MSDAETPQGFEDRIAENPTDPRPHLDYAAWLEGNGFSYEAEAERLLGSVLAEPYNIALRSEYAACLKDEGDDETAYLHYEIVYLLAGKFEDELVFTREGRLEGDPDQWPPPKARPKSVVARVQRRVKRIFRDHPEAQLVVADESGPGDYDYPIGEEPRSPGGVQSPLLYLSLRDDRVYRRVGAGGVADTSLCPYCGADAQDDWTPCPHLVTDLSEWPPTYGGTGGGSFDSLGEKCLAPLVRAGEALVTHRQTGKRPRKPVGPARLGPVLKALEEQLDDTGAPYEPVEECDVVKSALGDYIIKVFKELPGSGQVATYDCEDRWGTVPYLLWASAAAQAARRMADLIAEDVERLLAFTVGTKPGRGRDRRPRKSRGQ